MQLDRAKSGGIYNISEMGYFPKTPYILSYCLILSSVLRLCQLLPAFKCIASLSCPGYPGNPQDLNRRSQGLSPEFQRGEGVRAEEADALLAEVGDACAILPEFPGCGEGDVARRVEQDSECSLPQPMGQPTVDRQIWRGSPSVHSRHTAGNAMLNTIPPG
jgi:hypothetical protein